MQYKPPSALRPLEPHLQVLSKLWARAIMHSSRRSAAAILSLLCSSALSPPVQRVACRRSSSLMAAGRPLSVQRYTRPRLP
jgi:hypothetical protein